MGGDSRRWQRGAARAADVNPSSHKKLDRVCLLVLSHSFLSIQLCCFRLLHHANHGTRPSETLPLVILHRERERGDKVFWEHRRDWSPSYYSSIYDSLDFIAMSDDTGKFFGDTTIVLPAAEGCSSSWFFVVGHTIDQLVCALFCCMSNLCNLTSIEFLL